ncbi:Quinolinate phosphoribosyl transferase [Lactarius pseudohatsudake]|nr:Quinolinate phosphoribosyl transferase [Lactarius pseudohatsudake]
MTKQMMPASTPALLEIPGIPLGSKRAGAVLAGTPFVKYSASSTARTFALGVEWNVPEGDEFEPIKHVATVRGKARYLLLGERIALNLLARTPLRSKRTKDLAESYGFRRIIAGARKTTPGIYTAPWTFPPNAGLLLGFRLVEKYGMIVGGIDPHRFDLSNMIMLKDNHIWSAGSVTAAITRAREVGGFSLLLDVEVRDEEANEAIAAGADVIMLDNIEGDELVSVARRLRDRWEGKGKKFLLETSGGITEGNLRERAISGIDILSTSFVHQSVQHIDFSLKIRRTPELNDCVGAGGALVSLNPFVAPRISSRQADIAK